MTLAIHTRALTKRYGSHPHCMISTSRSNGVSVFGLIGPNGAGKTTTLRMLLDIIRPTSGDIEVLGERPRNAGAPMRRRIGYVPGELRLEGHVKGGVLLRHLAEISGPVAPGAIERLAERLDLDLSRPVQALSKGNKQKLGLVQAFMHQPELLVLDEPTSGLDPLVQREFLAMLREAQQAGQTVLLSSHVLSEVQQAADDVAVLAGGVIVAEGAVSALRIASVRRVRATLTGSTADAVRAALTKVADLDDLDVVDAPGDLVRVSATARGEIDPVMRALAMSTIRDLTVEEPDLEESVLDLYARTGAAS